MCFVLLVWLFVVLYRVCKASGVTAIRETSLVASVDLIPEAPGHFD